MDQTTIKELKRDLYRSLLLKEFSSWTESEQQILIALFKDDDIQEFIGAADRKYFKVFLEMV
jgi:hypothetical protein